MQIALRIFVALIGLLACPAMHGQMLFFGEDINTTATGGNEDAVRIPHPNADFERERFANILDEPEVEDFESFSGGMFIDTLGFGNI